MHCKNVTRIHTLARARIHTHTHTHTHTYSLTHSPANKSPLETVIYEMPLDQWYDVGGSKLDFFSKVRGRLCFTTVPNAHFAMHQPRVRCIDTFVLFPLQSWYVIMTRKGSL
jgi:hypothetical protein